MLFRKKLESSTQKFLFKLSTALVERQVFISEESWNERQTASSPGKAIEMSSTIESLPGKDTYTNLKTK